MLQITRDTIDVLALERAVGHPGAGGLVTFVGTVRDRHDGQDVTRIDYEVHAEMAQA